MRKLLGSSLIATLAIVVVIAASVAPASAWSSFGYSDSAGDLGGDYLYSLVEPLSRTRTSLALSLGPSSRDILGTPDMGGRGMTVVG